MPYIAKDRETPTDCLAAAVQALQTARKRTASIPAMRTELDHVIGRVGNLRGALLNGPKGLRRDRIVLLGDDGGVEHQVIVTSVRHGVQAECRCGWASPLRPGGHPAAHARAWETVKRAATAHLQPSRTPLNPPRATRATAG
jgi:hypothetical protein